MADITTTLENQQALQGEGKLVRTTEGGEPKRQGKTETMLRLIAAGAKPGNQEDAQALLDNLTPEDEGTAKALLAQHGIDADQLKSTIIEALLTQEVDQE